MTAPPQIRIAWPGSTSAARRAGNPLAATTTTRSTNTADASVTGSCCATPESKKRRGASRRRASCRAGSDSTQPAGRDLAAARGLLEVLDCALHLEQLRPLVVAACELDAAQAATPVARDDGVDAVVVGATRPEQVSENAKASGWKLPADLRRALDALFPATAA